MASKAGFWSGAEWALDRLDVLGKLYKVGWTFWAEEGDCGKVVAGGGQVDRLDVLGKLYIEGGGRDGCDGRGRDQAGGEQGDCDQSSCHRHKNYKKLGWCMLSA